jgi:hypothetical protein
MAYRNVVPTLVLVTLGAIHLFSQQGANPASAPEFPILLHQTVTAGKTPPGSKIQAKLAIATLVNGTVIPRNAVFSGEVVESVAMTATEPSRLSIRMDSAQWKDGSATIKAYFTGWYYPTVDEAGQDLQYGPQQPARRTWNGQGEYPDSNSHVYRPFPSGDSDKGQTAPDTSSSTTSKNRALMKNIEVGRSADGAVVLVSKHTNIKLEKYTTYVVSSGEAAAQK